MTRPTAPATRDTAGDATRPRFATGLDPSRSSSPDAPEPASRRVFRIVASALAVLGVATACTDSDSSERLDATIDSEATPGTAIEPDRTLHRDGSGEPSPRRPAKIEFEDLDFDFGHVVQGEEIRHLYRFRNVGDAPVRVRRVKASCGCAIPMHSEEPVPPGGEGTIELLLRSASVFGDIRKTIDVTTEPATAEPVQLVVRGTVEIEFLLSPPQTRLGELYPGVDAGDHSVEMTWPADRDVEVTEIETTAPSVVVTGREDIRNGRREGVRVTFRLDDWENDIEPADGRYHQYVVFRTNDPGHPRTTHAITGRRGSTFEVRPRVLNFGVLGGSDPSRKTVRILPRPGLRPAFLGADAPPWLRVRPSDRDTGDVLEVTIELLPTAPAGGIKETVKIRTGVPAQPEVSVFVLANVRKE